MGWSTTMARMATSQGRAVNSTITGAYIHPDWGSAAKGTPPITAGFQAGGSGPGSVASAVRRHLGAFILVAAAGGLVCGFFAGLYRHLPEPIGFDTSLYLTQATLVAKHGLRGVAHLVIPRPHKLWTSRIGFPVTVLSLSGLFRTSTFAVAAVVPIAAIAATALACGAFVTHGLRRGPVVLAVVAVIVGT